MTISKRETGYRELDFKIGIGLGAGMTGEEVAKFADCDRSTVYARKNANTEFIEFIANTTRAATAASIAATTEDLKESFEARYKKMYDKAVRNLEEFLDDDDKRFRFPATLRTIDQIEGRPVQRMKQEIESTHTERRVVELPEALSSYLIGAVKSTQQVLAGGLPEDIIEGELVTTTGAPAAGG